MDLKGPDFSDFRDPIFSEFSLTRFEIMGTRIGSLKRLEKKLDILHVQI